MIEGGHILDTSPIPAPSQGAAFGGAPSESKAPQRLGECSNQRCIEDASPFYQGFGLISKSVQMSGFLRPVWLSLEIARGREEGCEVGASLGDVASLLTVSGVLILQESSGGSRIGFCQKGP